MNVNSEFVNALYESMKQLTEETEGYELESLQTSVNVSELRKYGKSAKVSDIVAKIDANNNETNKRNLLTIAKAYKTAMEQIPFSNVEKYLFKRVLVRVRKGTDNFKYTYQTEMNEDTCGNSKSGLTPYRLTTSTVAGLRTCFNSLQYLDNEVSRTAKKQENEKALNNAAVKLAETLGIDANLITADMLKSLGFTRVAKVD